MPCQFGKQTALPFHNSVSHALSSFNLIHSDVWGPSPITTQDGSRYFVIFVDDFSRYTWIYLFKNRSELYQIYCDFTKMNETQFSKPIKVFKSDNAQEYKAHEFTSILHQFGIVPHSSCVGTSQQNDRAVRATTITASTPSQFWGEAALTAVYTINRCPSPIVQNQTPYDLLFGSSPSYDLLRVFGCVCFVLLQDHERNKLQSRSRLYCFLGYGIGQKGYRCYDPISKRLHVSRHVVFWEHKMLYQLPHVLVSHIPSIDSPPSLFPEESPTSMSEHHQSMLRINRCPSPIVQNQTPYDLLFGFSPSYDLLRVFGCVCFVLLQDHERNKLQSRSRLYCFLGYGIGQKGYRCYDPISKRLHVSRHVVFWEHKMLYQLPHVLVSHIPSIDSPPSLFPEESPTSMSEHHQSMLIINRCLSPIVQNQTPYDLLFGFSPSYGLLRVFGCVCFVLLQDHERNKLQSRYRLCCFFWYGIGQKSYKCYDPISKRLYVSRHVVF